MTVNTSFARVRLQEHGRIYAGDLDPSMWRRLQEAYLFGQLLMPCCDAPAVPKTSPLGLQFFAHASGTCGAAPESAWHQAAKEAVAAAAMALGYRAIIERPGKGWTADVWVDHPGGPAVVECQHSYQHLRDYMARQQRYLDAGIRCLWLVMADRMKALGKSMQRHRRKHEFGAGWPAGEGEALSAIPMAVLDLGATPWVRGLDLYTHLPEVLGAFLEDRLQWDRGRWLIDGISMPFREAPGVG
ncbi:hypothetical protein ACOTDN_15685 [Achromobacter xylosoxidans]